MAALAAVSLLTTWLLGMAALGVTGVYTVAKLAETAQVYFGFRWLYYMMIVVSVPEKKAVRTDSNPIFLFLWKRPRFFLGVESVAVKRLPLKRPRRMPWLKNGE